MLLCPSCASPELRVVISCQRNAGHRYRRHRCTDCDHRWSTYQQVSPPAPRKPIVDRAAYESRRLTDWQAAQIILSIESERTLAARYGISRASVQAIKHGTAYRNVWLHLQQLRPDPVDLEAA